MQITVRLFATLRQIAGWASQPLEVPEGATLREALAAVDARYPQLSIGTRTYYAAINQEYAFDDKLLCFPEHNCHIPGFCQNPGV